MLPSELLKDKEFSPYYEGTPLDPFDMNGSL